MPEGLELPKAVAIVALERTWHDIQIWGGGLFSPFTHSQRLTDGAYLYMRSSRIGLQMSGYVVEPARPCLRDIFGVYPATCDPNGS